MATRSWSVDWSQAPAELARARLEKSETNLAAKYDPACALVWREGPGHSPETRTLARVHDGRTTAEWVALRCLLYGANPGERPVLEALLRLQVITPGSPRFGCSRWYGEETQVHDTNAAFFICRLLVVRWLLEPDPAAPALGPLLRPYFERSAVWFARECGEPSLYYPNKIISDGCLCLALAHILDDQALLATAQAFLARWCMYTEKRGWGWGENLSVGYTGVILDAFWLALHFLPHGDLRHRLLVLQDELLANLAFHAPEQPVPAIRTYNFAGDTRCRGGVYSVLELGTAEPDVAPAWLGALLLRMSGADVLERIARLRVAPISATPRRREQRIFDDTVATSYVEGAARLGTVNRFPVMPGCNQHLTWGLGWQSMPASFAVAGRNYGFLQWATRLAAGVRRAHPAAGFQGGYAAPALFAEKGLPETLTLCRQQDRAAVVVRSVMHLANVAEQIVDQWRIPAFGGQCHVAGQEVRSPQNAGSTEWVLLVYPEATVAIRPLLRLAVGADAPVAAPLEVTWEEGALLLRQVLWQGPAQRLDQERTESGWVTVILPGVATAAEAARLLAEYRVEENWLADGELPRQSWQRIRRVHVHGPGATHLRVEVDPWRLPRI
jgi:hypothetical protein